MACLQLTRNIVVVLVLLAFALPAYAGRYDGLGELVGPLKKPFNEAAGVIKKADPPATIKLEYKPPELPSDTRGIKLPGGDTLSSTKEIKALLPPPNVPKGPTP